MIILVAGPGKGESIVNLEPLRRLQSKLSVAFIAAAALVLASCGGSGATSSPNVGDLQLLPGAGSIYAGVPTTFNIVGGRAPYLVTSSEPTLLELGFTTSSNSFTVVARNPGVVDVGLDPDEVPRRSVNIEVRDSAGVSLSATFSVLQNFFTGYGVFYANTCAAPASGDAPDGCSGTDSVVNLIPVSNGSLYGDREFELRRVRGDFQFVIENPAVTPQLVDIIRVRTDHEGKAIARLRVAIGAPTQIATYTVTDVATGATTTRTFIIVQQPVFDQITLLPDEITFTGGLVTECGRGTADVVVFGGTPPYTISGAPSLGISPSTVTSSGGTFSITAGRTSPPCPADQTVVVTDSRGAVGTVTVSTVAGTGTPPTLTAAPTTIANLTCGTATTVTVIGGAGLTASSQHPRVTATISGTTLTIRRLEGDGATIYPNSGTVTVTDGSSIVTITLTAVDPNCP
jgi:hypothetical protein